MHSLAAHRYRRIEESPATVLNGLCRDNPLYVHTRIWMSEMAGILPITETLATDDNWLSYPEQGLNLFLPAIRHMHAVSINHPSRPSTALEIATHGEPRSVSFAAIPLFSDIAAFRESLSVHPSLDLSAEEYDAWRGDHLVRPTACTCCAEAAKNRRKNIANSPLSRIFTDAIESRIPLHCQIRSDSFRFANTFIPGELITQNGHITLTSDDHKSMLEIDPGLCHALTFDRVRIDDEPMSFLNLSNSLGETELIISTPGFEACSDWIQLCKI